MLWTREDYRAHLVYLDTHRETEDPDGKTMPSLIDDVVADRLLQQALSVLQLKKHELYSREHIPLLRMVPPEESPTTEFSRAEKSMSLGGTLKDVRSYVEPGQQLLLINPCPRSVIAAWLDKATNIWCEILSVHHTSIGGFGPYLAVADRYKPSVSK